MLRNIEAQLDVAGLAQQTEAMYRRLQDRYQQAQAQNSPDSLPLFLTDTFRELGTASEELQVACEELQQQNEELAIARELVEIERQRFQNLFEFAPNAYLVTDPLGVVQEANRAAARLLQVPQQFLFGKPLVSCVQDLERRRFRNILLQLQQAKQVQEYRLHFRSRYSQPFQAITTVLAEADSSGKVISLRWQFHSQTDSQPVDSPAPQEKFSRPFAPNPLATARETAPPTLGRYPRQTYHKGEVIPCRSQTLYLVRQGVVKLTTFAESGEEVLVGLAGPGAVFGADLTSLPIYQAMPLGDVQLECLPAAEIATSPRLAQALLPQIRQRLRQTEVLLALTGRRYVKDRLYQFLYLLKQEMGESVAQGSRLQIRLTHEDLASACGTTRVTITRLLGEWRQQGLVTIGRDRHLILSSDHF